MIQDRLNGLAIEWDANLIIKFGYLILQVIKQTN